MPDQFSTESNELNITKSKVDTSPATPSSNPTLQLLTERLATYRGETSDQDMTQEDRDKAYRQVVNLFTNSYMGEVIRRAGGHTNLPENDTGSKELQIIQDRKNNIAGAILKFARHGNSAIIDISDPRNLYLAKPYEDADYKDLYVREDIEYKFISPDQISISPHIKNISYASSDPGRERDRFKERMKEEEFKERVAQFESEEEMDESMGIKRKDWHSTDAMTRQYMDLLVASFQALHNSDPEKYPDFQKGMMTLLTKGAGEAIEVLNEKSTPDLG